MKLYLFPANQKYKKCFVIVGGSGDNAEKLKPIATAFSENILGINFCTFSFSADYGEKNVFDVQIKELRSVCKHLLDDYKFENLIVFCTSMGAVATTKLLLDEQISRLIEKVIFFDPADYYLETTDIDHTWSGANNYEPNKEVYSDSLKQITSDFKVDVIHLTLRNYGKDGYLSTDYKERGIDNPDGFPRLSTKMVKSFFEKLPQPNKGKYIEVNNIPHAILRDGNGKENVKLTVNTIKSLL